MQSHGIADIEEASVENNTAYVQSVLVNKIKIGRVCCPYEVLRIKTGAGYFPVMVIYDTGAQLSLCNFETGPLLLRSRNADKKVTISTINSTKAKLRRVHTLTLGDGLQLDAVIIPNLQLTLQSMDIPEEWQDIAGTFADQDTFNVQAQILVGADKATIFPYSEKDDQGRLVQTSMCRLMRSNITNKLIMFGACEDHQDHGEEVDVSKEGLQVNQVQADNGEDEALASIMNVLAILDFDPTNTTEDTD